MKTLKVIGISMASLVLLISLLFGFGVLDLEFTKFYSPRKQNIERTVYENTKSYSHGKIQALTKYYSEYQSASDDEKLTIQGIIEMEFASFDENHITNFKLKSFLIRMRGF
jgi:hypothetical protein